MSHPRRRRYRRRSSNGPDAYVNSKGIFPDYVRDANGKKYSTSQIQWEARNYGQQYVESKYGKHIYDHVRKAIHTNKSYGRSGPEASSNGKKVKVRMGDGWAYRMIGDSSKNAPPTAKDGYVASRGRLRDGGPSEPVAPGPDNSFQRRLSLNLENDSELAQGSHHEWAQATSISSLITGQLRQGQNSAADYWDTWAQDKGGDTQLLGRDSSSFGLDVNYTPPSAQAEQAETNPMGAFGTQAVMSQYDVLSPTGVNYDTSKMQMTVLPGTGGTITPPTPTTGPDLRTRDPMTGAPPNIFDPSQQNYNPWSRGEGGQYNMYGPSAQTMAQGTMEAMALANAYFAPQRMELAYELGDMETDMRRLAANLGRQVDDPVLQAKLYKEGMRAVRTMDIQQNTFAFQMSEQRRKEDLQNFQFYDQLAQEELRMKWANRQFYDKLALDSDIYNLQYYQVMNMPRGTTNTTQVSNQGGTTSNDVYGGGNLVSMPYSGYKP